MPVAAPALLLPPRTPWPAGFPAVVVHTQTALRDHHPEYRAAKAGDAEAALTLAVDLLSDAGAEALQAILRDGPPSSCRSRLKKRRASTLFLMRWPRCCPANSTSR